MFHVLTLLAQAAPEAPQSLIKRLWQPDFPLWEFVFRGIVIYIFVLVLLRLTGKRQVGQLAPFDLVLLLILSNAVQNAMNGGDNTILGGAISAVTLVGLNYLVGYLTFKSKLLESIIEGRPVMIIHDGHINQRAMNCVRMTTHELNASLHANGCAGPHEVQIAILENSGNLTVIPKHNHEEIHAQPPKNHVTPQTH